MVMLRPLLVSHSNGHHLNKAALRRPDEIGVGLDPVDEDNACGLMGQPVHEEGNAVGLAHGNHVHGGLHRGAHTLLRDAPQPQHLLLPFSRCPAVRTHGRGHKRPAPGRLEPRNDIPDNHREIGDPPAPGTYGHPAPHRQSQPVCEQAPLPLYLIQHIYCRRHPKPLTNHPHLWKLQLPGRHGAHILSSS